MARDPRQASHVAPVIVWSTLLLCVLLTGCQSTGRSGTGGVWSRPGSSIVPATPAGYNKSKAKDPFLPPVPEQEHDGRTS